MRVDHCLPDGTVVESEQVPPSGYRPLGRWCATCETLVSGSHKRDMLMARKIGHDPVLVFVRRSDDEKLRAQRKAGGR